MRSCPPTCSTARATRCRPHDWRFFHRPTPGQILFAFPRGKVVGGSSAVNTCIALRGQPYDYDEWAALGLADWSFDRCLPAFKRLETDLDFDNEWHGQRRPDPDPAPSAATSSCPGRRRSSRPAQSSAFRAAATTTTRPKAASGPHAMNKVDGERMSAARCYLTREVRARKTSRSVRARWCAACSSRTGGSTGVEVERDGAGRGRCDANRVVLSAGAILSPAILLRSRHRAERGSSRGSGVELACDVPAVGARLLDHPGAAIVLVPKRGVSRSITR